MTLVRLTSAAVAHPVYRFRQDEISTVAELFGWSPKAAAFIGGKSHIATRALVLPPTELAGLGSIGARNDLYRKLAPDLAKQAVGGALASRGCEDIGCLVTSSCTGYALPGWAVDLLETFGLSPTTVRVPLTESGCAGGVVAIGRLADYLRSRPGESGLAVATEICSLSFRPSSDGDHGFTLACLIFGDGAGAVVAETGPGQGLQIIDSLSYLVADSKSDLGGRVPGSGVNPGA